MINKQLLISGCLFGFFLGNFGGLPCLGTNDKIHGSFSLLFSGLLIPSHGGFALGGHWN